MQIEEIALRIEAIRMNMVRVHSLFFVNGGFTRSHADHSLYVLQTCDYIVIVIMNADKIIILTSNMGVINELKSSFKREFKMSNLNELHFFLEVHFERDRRTRTITMYQQNYIKNILERFGMGNCKPITTPLDTKTALAKLLEEAYEENSHAMKDIPYKKVLGSLMYTMVATRPDFAFVVNEVSRFTSKPGPMH